jgi:hypothetical protein
VASGFPVLWALVMVVVFGGMFLYQKKMREQSAATYAQYGLADVAGSIGLSVVEGDPMLNLMLVHQAHSDEKMSAQGNMLQKLAGDSAKDTRARAAGQVWGRAYELSYHQRSELDVGITVKTWKLYFDFSLACVSQVDVLPFEILLRTPQQSYMQPKIQTELPPQSTGNAHLDSLLVVKCNDPRFAAAIVPALIPLMTLPWVHLVGSGREIRAITTQYTHSCLLMNLATYQKSLEHIACILEGRPVPDASVQATA